MGPWILLLALATAAPESARVRFKAVPPPEQLVKMSPGDDYRALVTDEYARVEAEVARVRAAAAGGDPADIAATYDSLVALLGEARSRLVGWPSYKDRDGRLRDAIIETYKTWGTLAERERDEVAPLAVEVPRDDKHVRAWEMLRVQLDKEWSRSNASIREVVDGFAQEHRLVFVADDDDGGDRAPAFQADLPVRTELPPAFWVTAAIRYHNALYQRAGEMAKAMGGATDKMNTTELEPARVAALEAIEPALADARAFGAFGGSTALRDAVVAYGEFMVAQLTGPLRRYAELTRTGKVTPEEAEELERISEALNDQAARHAAAVQKAREQFAADWAFEAFVAWQEGRRAKK